MLVLSRKQDQQIVIGDNITITLLKIRGNTARIGIEAPNHVTIVRAEISEAPHTDDDTESSPDDSNMVLEFKTNDETGSPSLRLLNEGSKTSGAPVNPPTNLLRQMAMDVSTRRVQ